MMMMMAVNHIVPLLDKRPRWGRLFYISPQGDASFSPQPVHPGLQLQLSDSPIKTLLHYFSANGPEIR